MSTTGLPICTHCRRPIALRNPTGFCDHLYYPDSCPICRRWQATRRWRKAWAVALYLVTLGVLLLGLLQWVNR